MKGLELGLDSDEIAKEIFNITLPYVNKWRHRHSYPFVTGDTFRAFADIVFTDKTLLKKPSSRYQYHNNYIFYD